jgi:glucose-1-phosphate adenylyltransferase
MPSAEARYISRLTRKTLAVVLAGGRGSRLGVLTDWRTKPAVPFAGKFRIIDFTLSNCLNADIRKVCVLTQYMSHSLIQHLMKGWTFLNSEHQYFLDLVPAQQWRDEDSWYEGTADAVHQSLDIITGYGPEYILILAGDHVYTMDYGAMLATHMESKADFTIACKTVPVADATEFGVMKVDESGRIVGFQEKPKKPEPLPEDESQALISMGIYVAPPPFLSEQLNHDAANADSTHDFGQDVIPYMLANGHHIQSHTFTSPTEEEAYWRDVGTIDAFFQANLEQLSPPYPINFHDPAWPILTHHPQLPPAHLIGEPGSCHFGSSMISAGCIVDSSSLTNSMLYSNVTVDAGCKLDGVLALPGCRIGAGSRLTNVILDNQCQVPVGTLIGEAPAKDAERFVVTPGGVTVVNREMLGQGVQYMPGVMPQELFGDE